MPRKKIHPSQNQLIPATHSRKITAHINRPRPTELHRLIRENAPLEALQQEIKASPNDINIQDPSYYNMTPLCALVYQFFVDTKIAENRVTVATLTPEEIWSAGRRCLEETYDGPLDPLSLMAQLQNPVVNADENESDGKNQDNSDGENQDNKDRTNPINSKKTLTITQNTPNTSEQTITKIKLLRSNGADLEIESEKGTPFQMAIYSGNIEIVKWFIANGGIADLSTGVLYAAIKTLALDTIPETIKYFLEGSRKEILNTQYYNFDNRTLVHGAIEYGHLHMLIYLVEQGANIGIKDKMGQTPLELAQNKNQLWAVSYLQQVSNIRADNKIAQKEKIERIKNLRSQLTRADSANARYASAGQRTDIFEAIGLMANGLTMDSPAEAVEATQAKRRILEQRIKREHKLQEDPRKALKEFIKENDLATIRELAAECPPAIFLSYLSQKSALASHPARNTINRAENLLEFALSTNPSIFKYFLEYAQQHKLTFDLLTDAITAGNFEQLKSLIAMGKEEPLSEVSISAPSNKHLLGTAVTIIIEAPKNKSLRHNHLRILSYLLDELKKREPSILLAALEAKVPNADITIRNMTPLHYAAMRRDLEIVKLLVEHSTNVNQCCAQIDNNTHISPLHLALYKTGFEHQAFDIVRFLVEKEHIDVNSGQKKVSSPTDNPVQISNPTPLDYAIFNQYWDIAQYLYKKGAQCNQENIHILYGKCPDLKKFNTVSEEEIQAKQENERKRQQVFNYLQNNLRDFIPPQRLAKPILEGEQFKLEFPDNAAAEKFKEIMLLYFSNEELTLSQITVDNTTISFSISKLLPKIEKKGKPKKQPLATNIPFHEKYPTILQKLELLKSLFAHYGLECSFEILLSQPDFYEFKLTSNLTFTHDMRINFNQAAQDNFGLEQRKRTKKGKATDWILRIKKAALENIAPELIADMKKVDLHKQPSLEAPPISYLSRPDETAYRVAETEERKTERRAAEALKALPVGYIDTVEETHSPTKTDKLLSNETGEPENPTLQEEKILTLGQSAKSAGKEKDPSLDFSWISLETESEDKRTGGTEIQKKSEDIPPKQRHPANQPKEQNKSASRKRQKMTIAEFHQKFPTPPPAKNEKSESEPEKSAIALPQKPQQTATTASPAFFSPSSAATKKKMGPEHNRQPAQLPYPRIGSK